MTLSSLLSQAREAGLDAKPHHVHTILVTGRAPAPEIDGAANKIYTAEHLAALRSYLASPRRRGKRPLAERQSAGV